MENVPHRALEACGACDLGCFPRVLATSLPVSEGPVHNIEEGDCSCLGLEDEDGEGDEEPVLDDARDVHGERARLADQQEHRHVEAERSGRIRHEYVRVKADLQSQDLVCSDALHVSQEVLAPAACKCSSRL